jgi:GNAT superfamily N-acetyltransferase
VALAEPSGLAVRMRIEQVDLTDAETLRACHGVNLAAGRIDTPEGPWLSEQAFGNWMTTGWGGEPREVWAIRLVPGQGPVTGWYRLQLPDRENLDRAHLNIVVHPEARRRGTGRALLRHAAGRMAEHGRSVLTAGADRDSPGEAFARSAGAEPGIVEIKRMMEPGRLELARLREPAERAAADYSLVSWAGLVPDEFGDQAAALYSALNDAPNNPGVAPEVWDAQRVRDSVNVPRQRSSMHHYSIAARHDASGELAALTEMAIDPADPGWGHQLITAVIRKHRGHRLGLLVKIGMLELLATAEPQVARIVTWNAEINEHMIAVNEALGYRISGQPHTSYRVDVAALLA